MEQLIEDEAAITPGWIEAVAGVEAVRDVAVARIGTGQMSRNLRVSFSSDAGPGSFVVKVPSDDPTSRATGAGLGAYFRETAFYTKLGPSLAGAVPECLLSEYRADDASFTLVLADAAPAEQGDQIAGCSFAEAERALAALASIQAPVLGDPVTGGFDWLNQANPLNQQLYNALLPGFLARYAERVAPEHAAVLEEFGGKLDAWAADRRAPLGLVHGDFRLDNLLFDAERCLVVDWQTVAWGSAVTDVSYFLGGSLQTEDRRTHEAALVRGYHDALLAAGTTALSWEMCWEEYRRQSFAAVVMGVIAPMVVEQTDRGDDMFTTVMARACQQIIDLDALALLPADGGAPVAALRPEPEDEGLHEPGAELLWNESLYFDAVSDDEQLGVYLRIGRLPNQDACFYAVCLCGPGRPSIMLVLEPGPLPDPADPEQRIDVPTLRAAHVCEEPLQRFRVALDGTAGAHADPSAPLRAAAGEDVAIALDLTWETDGIPYAWRAATRYEIPCRVSGAVRIGEEEIAFAGTGQRDHSWGSRDWWAVNWMWTALHLDDGTRLHAVGVPGSPVGVGYVQRDGELTEVSAVTATHTLADDGLVTAAHVSLSPPELALSVEPVGYGAIRLVSPDGRVAEFPRAMCRVRTQDGRAGVGWMEWNLVDVSSAAPQVA